MPPLLPDNFKVKPTGNAVEAHGLNYRPDIDGLRALAVIPVVLFHAGLGCPGGYVGVDVFFVISGYLITSLIIKEQAAGTFDLIRFWERRILRILPALVLVLVASILAAWWLVLPPDFETFGRSLVAQALLLSNAFFYRQAGYFAAGSDAKPLLHTWSLAVEEQFYLVYPLLLVALVWWKRSSGLKAVGVLAAGSFGLSVVGTYTHAWATFFLLPTRAWELMAGGLLAMANQQNLLGCWRKEALGWIGTALIIGPVLLYSETTRFPGLAAVPPCLGAILLISSSERGFSMAGRLLASRPLVLIGLISSSLYLWHWPLLVFSRYSLAGDLSLTTRISLLVASIGLALLSWKFVETPFRRRLVIRQRSGVFVFAGVSLGLLVVGGWLIVHNSGFPARIAPVILRYVDYGTHRAFLNDISLDQALDGRFAQFGEPDSAKPVHVIIWGDSQAMAATPALDELCRRHSLRGVQATHSQTLPP
ncbi:MAG: acyltransferase [Proteobacteria bacterium]|nr:acyltransferase [Pseudomonadota bacterium]